MMHFKPLIVFLVAATLTAAARADEDEYAGVHTVAVVSTLGGALHWETTGMTRFDVKDEKLHLDWNIDDYIEHSIAGVLRGRFAVSGQAPSRPLFAGSYDGALPRNARAAVAGVNAYVVVRPSKLPDHDTAGIVVSHHGGAVGDEATFLRSSFEVDVFDAHSGQRIDYGTANSPILHAQWGLSERCDDSLWASPPASLSARQKSAVAAAIRSAVDRTLPFALSNAKLIPEDAARSLAAPDAGESGSATCHPS
jgi:hypothetical protein